MSLLGSVIGWLAPATCVACESEGSALCEPCAAAEVIPFGERCWRCGAISNRSLTCPSCRHTGSPNHIWISTDYEAAAKDLVQTYKFQHQRSAAEPLAGLMAETFLTYNSDSDIAKNKFLLIPVPTATSRVRERSFDHTALLTRKLGLSLRLNTAPALARLGQERQVGAKRGTRLAQLEDKFYVSRPQAVVGRRIILVDDVLTTGSTLIAAAKALRAAGARSVDALVFAKKL